MRLFSCQLSYTNPGNLFDEPLLMVKPATTLWWGLVCKVVKHMEEDIVNKPGVTHG
jgi:hypothetical protein